jgi:hypothetical protein
MDFRTRIDIAEWSDSITYTDELFFMGSCFAEHIGQRMIRAGFDGFLNPFGIVYNPLSIADQLHRVMDDEAFREEDLVLRDGVYRHWSCHSSLAASDSAQAVALMNDALNSAHAFLARASRLILTFGTAKLYRLKEGRRVVSNCHRFPADTFQSGMTGLEELIESYGTLLERLKAFNMNLEVSVTLSPVRHWKDGALENSYSKSLLRVFIEKGLQEGWFKHYFPAYEIQMDELRDYRFYADDMLHPSEQAQSYIWSRWKEAVMDEPTRRLEKEVEKLHRMRSHRPLFPGSSGDELFQKKKHALEQEVQASLEQAKAR